MQAPASHGLTGRDPDPRGRGFLDDFREIVRADGARLFADFQGQPLTFAELDRRSDREAHRLRAAGIGRGDRVALMLRNSLRCVATIFAIAKLGAVWVPINTRQVGEGLRFILERSQARLIVIEPDLADLLDDPGAGLAVNRLIAGDEPAGSAAEPAQGLPDAVAPAPGDLFALCYTSGTTGRPKGVPVTHEMLRHAGEAAARTAGVASGDVLFMWEPLHHIGGAQMLVVPIIRRATLAMVERFSASAFWAQVRKAKATHIHYLGGILQILLKQPPDALDRRHAVRIAWGGGCAAEIWRAFESRFGVQIRECYGMTESSSITTSNTEGIVGSVGRPVPWFAVDIVDPDTGAPVAAGGKGEIVVRALDAGALFTGYLDEAEATARALRNGLFHTGDIGSFDAAGRLFFHGRASDSVRTRGENVSAWEVERVVNAHPSIADSAMIGVPSDIGEADIKLFVQLKPGQALHPHDLSQWLAGRLAPHQLPRYVAVVESFPRTGSERIMKHKLDRSVGGCWDRLAAADRQVEGQ